jgi:hypothetical protein
MTTKVCRNCHEQKEIIEFPKHRQMKDGHLNQCIVCKKDYLKKYGRDNKENLSEKNKQRYETNKEQIKERVRTYRKRVLDECSRSNAKCRPERRKSAKENKSPSYYLELCRKRMWHAFNGREAKSDKTKALLGCDGIFLKKYLESKKVKGKDYTNAHIIPCSSFDMSDEEQQRKCFHYTNLQLLPAHENLIKSNHIW